MKAKASERQKNLEARLRGTNEYKGIRKEGMDIAVAHKKFKYPEEGARGQDQSKPFAEKETVTSCSTVNGRVISAAYGYFYAINYFFSSCLRKRGYGFLGQTRFSSAGARTMEGVNAQHVPATARDIAPDHDSQTETGNGHTPVVALATSLMNIFLQAPQLVVRSLVRRPKGRRRERKPGVVEVNGAFACLSLLVSTDTDLRRAKKGSFGTLGNNDNRPGSLMRGFHP
ncbi:hypothetical protein MKZ38_000828 [Zalerion maritima]|uniref:Uncharacterized protein n=1 Tax=Zalerion maritima TaxID=339359 RepID=A0AAD5RYR5_9PEZI|nr:hypothetical protein MKZ38_000828 [Zalerion maritima]